MQKHSKTYEAMLMDCHCEIAEARTIRLEGLLRGLGATRIVMLDYGCRCSVRASGRLSGRMSVGRSGRLGNWGEADFWLPCNTLCYQRGLVAEVMEHP